MKLYAFAIVALLAAGPAAASGLYYGSPQAGDPFYAPTSMHAAHFELGVGVASDGNTSVTQLDAVGRVAWPAFHTFRAEAEAFGGAYSSGSGNTSAFGAVGHLYKEDATHALGAYAGTVTFDDSTVYLLGAEGKVYVGQTAFGGLAGVMIPESGSSAYVLSGGAQHYFTPDHKAALRLAYYVSSASGTSSVWSAQALAEKRFTGTPWSLFASGSYLSGNGSSIWSGRVGFRAFLDAPGTTLQQHDRLVPFDAISLGTFVR